MVHLRFRRCLPAWLGLLLLSPCAYGQKEGTSAVVSRTPGAEIQAPAARLEKSKSGSVLILEEGENADVPVETNGKDDGLSGRPARALPPDYRAFRDQHVIFYVEDIPAGLESATKAAMDSGGQMISYPIKGFENMGPNERTLVFESRAYPSFLAKLEALGTVESPELGRSDFVTVRLTVLVKPSPSPSPSPPLAPPPTGGDYSIIIICVAAVVVILALALLFRKKK